MCRKTILSAVLLVAGAFFVTAFADDPSPAQKPGNSDGNTQTAQGAPAGRMMGRGMMGGPMMEHRTRLMQMHQKMQAEMKAMDVENDRMVTEMNQATGQKKIDAMAALLMRLVAQRKMMVEKMGAMHADMMQMKMEGMGADTANEPAEIDKLKPAHEHSATDENSEQKQHQH